MAVADLPNISETTESRAVYAKIKPPKKVTKNT